MRRARTTRKGFGSVGRAALLFTVVFNVFAVPSMARAETWAVQVMALRDLRDATALANDLVRLGFDAYTEFAMRDGQQFVRVRFGCFAERAVADAFARLAHDLSTTDAVVVPIDEGAAPRSCLARDVGFVIPETFRQPVAGSATFEVEVAGTAAIVRYQGGRWQLLQRAASEARPPVTIGAGPFVDAALASMAFVMDVRTEPPTFLCPGSLLAALDDVAIVDDDGVVVACSRSERASEGTR